MINSKLIYTALIVVFTAALSVFSQADSVKTLGDTIDISDDKNVEMLIENETEDAEESELLDRLLQLEANPVDLNTAGSNELQTIPYIDAILATKILEYRQKNTKYYSVIELRYVEGIDREVYDLIIKYVRVKNSAVDFQKDEYGVIQKINDSRKGFFNKLNINARSRFSNDLQPSAGYLGGDERKYPGTRPKFYNRLNAKYTAGRYIFSGSLLTEKDPGEESWTDHIGGYIEMKSPLILNQMLIGDYTLEFGQGLTLWGSVFFFKGKRRCIGYKEKGRRY